MHRHVPMMSSSHVGCAAYDVARQRSHRSMPRAVMWWRAWTDFRRYLMAVCLCDAEAMDGVCLSAFGGHHFSHYCCGNGMIVALGLAAPCVRQG